MTPYVLYVEDDKDDVQLTTLGLQSTGFSYPLKIARDGHEALTMLARAIQRAEPLPALVLLDIKMPKLNGFELLRRLRSDPVLRSIPAAFLTSSAYGPDRAQALALGAELYLLKPSDLRAYADIKDRLDTLIESRTADQK